MRDPNSEEWGRGRLDKPSGGAEVKTYTSDMKITTELVKDTTFQ